MAKKGTSTSKFGTSGRRNHDASAFYERFLYRELPGEKEIVYQETALPEGVANRILSQSAAEMSELPAQSVHLMVTSPPYNVGKEYDENLTLEKYTDFLKQVWSEVYRVLVPGGRVCINVANLGRKPYLPLHVFITQDMLSLGFLMRGEIIWDKAASAAGSTAWGSWCSASNPTLRDVHEYILVFSKDAFRRERQESRSDSITRDEFLEYTRSVWAFPTESARKVGHPAPFPIELPYRLIQLYSYENEVVLDPFMGSGQTALAALKAGRRFVGYEIEPEYIRLAEERIQAFRQSLEGR